MIRRLMYCAFPANGRIILDATELEGSIQSTLGGLEDEAVKKTMLSKSFVTVLFKQSCLLQSLFPLLACKLISILSKYISTEEIVE